MNEIIAIRTITAIRYVTPLREGGSLPAIVEADDGQLYVLKFCGAGQGPKALIAELVAGELGRTLGLPVPEIVLAELDPALGRSEPDPEIQDLIRFSAGLNLALAYLPGAFAFDPLLNSLGPELASAIVWFDGYVTNVDRTPRNNNILIAQGHPWLIDHGAALYFHHDWNDYLGRSRSRFPQIKEHVLLPFATRLSEVDASLSARLTPAVIDHIIALIPASWLGNETEFANHEAHRAAYATYLRRRLEAPRAFVEEAIRARA
ncbi:MAG: aminotransferase class I and II [Chloroflexi bacterium]|nr:aminotransferase class I and II [Chloroflexota bacterium]